MNKNYQLKQLWDDKYNQTNCERYEWIISDRQAFKLISAQLLEDKDIHILELGCGTSQLSDLIYDAGYRNITCVDFSKRLIKKRAQKNKERSFINADFTQQFKFEQGTKYDMIIDKGSLDCVFCDENYLKKVLLCVKQCYDRLIKGGKLISISLSTPKNRVYWLRNKLIPFEVQVRKQTNQARQQLRKNAKNYNKSKDENSQEYYIYVCTKTQQSGEDGLENNMAGLKFDNDEDNGGEDNYEGEQQQGQDKDGGEQANEQQLQTGDQFDNQEDKQDENLNQKQQKNQQEEEQQNYDNQFDDQQQ